jgi:hypothetical protein
MKGHGGIVSETRHHPVTSTEDRPINDAGLKSAPLCAVTPEDIKAVVSGRADLAPTVGTDPTTESNLFEW